MKVPTYKKNAEGKLEIKETLERVHEFSLEELQHERIRVATDMSFYQNRLDELDALITKAREIGVVEKIEIVNEEPAEVSEELSDESE